MLILRALIFALRTLFADLIAMGRDTTPTLGFIHDWVLNFKVKYSTEEYSTEQYSTVKCFTIDPKVLLCVDFTSLVEQTWETELLKMSALRNGLRFDFAACLRDNKLLQKLYEKNQILLRDLGVGSLDNQKAFLDEAFIYHYVRILERPWNSDNKNSLPTLQHIPEKLFTFTIEDLHLLEHKAREECKRLVSEHEERDAARKRVAIVTREALMIMQSTEEKSCPPQNPRHYMRENAAINLEKRASLTPEKLNTINEDRKKLVQEERVAREQRDAKRDAKRHKRH